MSTSHHSTREAEHTTAAWAREVAAHPVTTPTTEPAGRAGRRAGGARHLYAAAMVASPLAMTAWFLVEPAILPREEPTAFLASVAAAPDRYQAATLLVALAAGLSVLAAFGFASLLRPRIPRLGTVIAALTFLSGVGLAMQVGFRVFVWSMVSTGSVPAWAVPSFAAFQDGGAFDVLVAPGLVFGGLATLLLVGWLFASRALRWWVPVALLVGMLLGSGEFPDAVTVTGAAVTALANVRLARLLLAG